jgi:integrase
MASLQASHSRRCALSQGRKSPRVTPFEIPEGCTCTPGYFVDLVHDGKKVRQPVGRNRKSAERALNKVRVDRDEGAYEPVRDIRFDKFADEWYAALKRPKESTKDGYKTTIDYAKAAFGAKIVRRLGAVDVDHFLATIAHVSPSTQAKHLRVLGAMLRAAVKRGYTARNPLERLDDSHRPQVKKRESAYFEDAELPRLVASLDNALYRTAVLLALKTGLRAGELGALTWGDVDMTNTMIHVRQGKTKTAIREVDITPDVVELLGQWWGECGRPENDVLVFSTGSGSIPYWAFTKQILYPALKRAGIERIGPTGEKRTFHSLRHSYARITLENGAPLFWLSRQLGHSSVQVTQDVYGHFSRSARKTEAEKLEGVFNV